VIFMIKRRKTIALDENLVIEIGNIARRKGMSLSSYLRRLLTASIVAEKHGINPDQALHEQIILKYAKTVGLTLIPIEDVGSPNINKWEATGRRLGLILKIRDIDKIRALKDTSLLLLSGIGDLTIEEKKDTTRITCITSKTNRKVLEAIALMLERAAEQLGIKTSTRVDEGIIIVEFKK